MPELYFSLHRRTISMNTLVEIIPLEMGEELLKSTVLETLPFKYRTENLVLSVFY